MSETLRPCPFCGGEAETASVGGVRSPWGGAQLAALGVTVVCRDCGATIPSCMREEDTIAAWNTRAAVTDEQFTRAVHDGSWWGRCSDCEERRGYYEDAETIRNQQERIESLKAENGELRELVRISVEYCANGYCEPEDACPMLAGPYRCMYAEKARGLGIEVGE